MEQELKKTTYKKLSKSATKKLASSFKTVQGKDVLDQIKAGKNTFLKYERIINASYDMRWVNEIEDTLGDLGNIVKNPTRVTKEVTDVVPVELARKINAESVNHLSTHPQYIKEQKEDGEIVLDKILNIGSDDFYQTYENKFIATLIRKLIIFVEKRYQYLYENQKIKRTNVMMLKNKCEIDGREVEIETKVTITKEELSQGNINTNKVYLDRVKELKRYLLFYYNSPFMKMMKTEGNVRSPIIMTNIIRKNPRYNHCYRLYKFIEDYDLMGVNFKVNDKYTEFNDQEKRDISDVLAMNFLATRPEESQRNVKKKLRKFNPKVVTNADDEEFAYGSYYRGPLEFVRADDKYLTYLDALKKPTPVHPTKAERAYYGDEIALNQEIKDELQAIKELLARKRRDYEKLYREFEQIVYQREFEAFQLSEAQRRKAEDDLLRELEEARRELMKCAADEFGGTITDDKEAPEVESPFDKLKKHEQLTFTERLEAADESLRSAYEKIRHEALCFGLHSRISKKADSMRLHNKTYLRFSIVGKSLRCHYALDPKDYADSPIPVKDVSNIKQYIDIPLLLKVRSELSVKRAIKLIHDLAEKYGLIWDENIKAEQYEVEQEEEKTNPFENLKKNEFVPFTTRVEQAAPELADAYRQIRHRALCYGLHSRVSKRADTMRLHNKTYMKFAIVGKSLKLHYALEPKDYADSPIPVKDDASIKQYIDIPLMFKVRSELSVKRAIKLVDDLAAKYGLIYDENIKEDQIEIEENAPEEVEPAEVETEENEVPASSINPFANFKKNEFVPFSTRVEQAAPELANAYKEIRHYALCYGLHSRVSKRADTMRLHNVTYMKIAIVGKSLKLHYALDPKEYIDSAYPIKDDAGIKQYEDIPLMFKVRSDLSIKRAKKLIDDLASKYGFIYDENISDDQIEIEENAIEEPEIEETEVEETEVVTTPSSNVFNPFANLKKNEFIPFTKRVDLAAPELADAYRQIRHYALCYGLHSRVSKRADTMRLHNKTYLKFAIVGKSLKLHYALEPKEYFDSPYPTKDDSGIKQYEDIPLMFKVRSELSVKRAIKLIDDLAAKYNLIYDENIKEDQIEIDDSAIEEPEVDETELDENIAEPISNIPVMPINPFANFKRGEFVPFEKRIEQASPDISNAYREIRHAALCYGLHSRISKKVETMRLHNVTYMKIALVGKTLKIHYALEPAQYVGTSLPIKDDSDLRAYEDVPLMFKVRSDLSVRRAIKLIEDLAAKFGLTYNEIIDDSQYEGSDVEDNEPDDIESEDEVINEMPPIVGRPVLPTAPINPFANFKRGEFVPFEKRIEQASPDISSAYHQIKHQALCYGLHSRVSLKGDTFRLHGKAFLKINIVGKTLKCHYALDPKAYESSSYPVEDDGSVKAYEEVPMLFKVRSDLSVRRAVKLVDDLAAQYGFEFDENITEDQYENSGVEDEYEEPVEMVEDAEETVETSTTRSVSEQPLTTSFVGIGSGMPSAPSNIFATFKHNEYVPFEKRVEDASFETNNAYSTIRHHALCYGLHSRITKKYEAFRLHKEEYLRIYITGKTLKVYFALDPSKYENGVIPVVDCRDQNRFYEIPLMMKVRSDLSIRRAIKLIDDMALENGLAFSTEFDKALLRDDVEAPEIEEMSIKDLPFDKFKKLRNKKSVPFEKKVKKIDRSLVKAYEDIKNLLEANGLHSRVSNKFDTFKLRNETLVKISVIGKGLRIHFALDPKTYENSPIPVLDHSSKSTYKDVPLELKVRSGLSIRRAFILVDDLFKKYNIGQTNE